MSKWDHKIDDWILKVLDANERLGRNKIYEHVDERYKKVRKKANSLSKDVFDKHLKFLIENAIIGKNDAGQKGTIIEHFLNPEAKQQFQMGTLDLRALKNKSEKSTGIMTQLKFKALYTLILMFNHTTSYEFRNEDELISFLAPFHLKLNIPSISRVADSEENEKERRHEKTIIESRDKGLTISIHDYVNRYHGGITSVYNCQIRGMTKKAVISNRIGKPFQYMSFSSNQLNEAFEHLCKEEILRPIRRPDVDSVYRIVDNDVYFLLFFLEDLFTEYVIPVMRSIWKYLRDPIPEERKWLTLLEGGDRANKIIIEDNGHRREVENAIRRSVGGIEIATRHALKDKKIEKRNEIETRLKIVQEELGNYTKTYEFIINRHVSLQHIFEIMFPGFLRHLELH